MATKIIPWTSGSGNITVNYGGSGNGQIVVQSDDNNLYEQRSQKIVVSTTAGSPQRSVEVTIAQAARQRIDLSMAVVTAAAQTYSGSALTPTPTVTLGGETVPSTGYDVSYSNNTNAGTATVTITGKGDYTGTASGSFTINKANPTYTAPTAKSLSYSRGSQALLNAGSTSHGTIQYSSNGSSWSTTIPSQTNAGSYTVYWRLVGDSNHNDVGSTGISVTIAKVTPVVATSPSARTGLVYTGSNQSLLSGGSMKHSSTDTTAVAGTFSYKHGKNAGSYASLTWSFSPTDSTNYNSTSGTVSGTVSIAKANPTYVAPTANNRTYNTSSAALLNAGSNTTAGTFTYCSTQSGTYSTTIPSQTNAGTYTTWWKFTPTDTTNYNSIGATAVSTTISAKTVSSPTITLSQSSYTYSGSACQPTVTVKDGSTTISSSEYTVSYSNNVNAGTATVTITDNSGGNYTVSGSTTFTINKANPTYTAPTAKSGLKYTGSAQALLNAGSTSHGEIQYSGDGSTWSTTIPTGTSVTTYTVYWRLVGDSNHNDVSSTSISVSIGKATGTLTLGTTSFAIDWASSQPGTLYVTASNSGWENCPTSVKSLTGYNVFRSVGNNGINSSYAVLKLTFVNNTGAAVTKTVKVGPCTESTYDYTYIASWDASDITSNTVPSTVLYKGSGVTTEWTDVTLTIPTGTHTLQIVYRKDSSVNNSPDCGYFAMDLPLSVASVKNSVDKGGSTGTVTYTSSATGVATVSSAGLVTIKGTGTTTITVSMAATTNYTAASKTYTVTVSALDTFTSQDFEYTGAVQSVTLRPGTYKLQCWGAQGGSNAANSTYSITAKAGGKGGYSEGVLTLTEEKTLYIFVGGQGSSSGNGGWNGGGGGSGSSSYNASNTNGVSRMGGGGGATDIALVTSTMSYSSYRTNRSSESLLSRIIVAGGGSGGAMSCKAVTTSTTVTDYSISGSKLTAKSTDSVSSKKWIVTGTASVSGTKIVLTPSHSSSSTTKTNYSQVGFVGGGTTGGGYSTSYTGKQSAAGTNGGFGYGANQTATNYRYCSACGGGGWYGGGGGLSSDSTTTYTYYSGGGSGFVNTSASSGNRPSGYTGLQLDSGTTYDGTQTFVAPGGSNETGHSGNGYARITKI